MNQCVSSDSNTPEKYIVAEDEVTYEIAESVQQFDKLPKNIKQRSLESESFNGDNFRVQSQ